MLQRYREYAPQFQLPNVLSSSGAAILGLGNLMPLGYLTWAMLRGPRAGANPWDATGLEWQTPVGIS